MPQVPQNILDAITQVAGDDDAVRAAAMAMDITRLALGAAMAEHNAAEKELQSALAKRSVDLAKATTLLSQAYGGDGINAQAGPVGPRGIQGPTGQPAKR